MQSEALERTSQGLVKKFDPLMIAKSFIGKIGDALLSRTPTLKKNDTIAEQKTASDTTPGSGRKVGKIDTAFYTTINEGMPQKLRKDDGVALVASKLLNLYKSIIDDQKRQDELRRDFQQEKLKEEEKRNQELIDVLKEDEHGTKTNTKKLKDLTKPFKKVPKKEEFKTPKIPEIPKEKIPTRPRVEKEKPTVTKEPSTSTKKPKPVKEKIPERVKPSATKSKIPREKVKPSKLASVAKIAAGSTTIEGLYGKSKEESEDVSTALENASSAIGIDRGLMYAIAAQESGFNAEVGASQGSAKGLFQFIDKTWNGMENLINTNYPEYKQYIPLLDRGPKDAEANAIMGAILIKDGARQLSAAGIPPTPTNVYTSNFLGPGGAKKFLKAPDNALAYQVAGQQAADYNKYIFYKLHNVAGKMVPDLEQPRTVGEVKELLYNKIVPKQQQFAKALGETASKTAYASVDNQGNDIGSRIYKSSDVNQEYKKSVGGNSIAIDNSQTIITASGKKDQKILSNNSSRDNPINPALVQMN
jgi:outer membrane biosynthesis protein TonB